MTPVRAAALAVLLLPLLSAQPPADALFEKGRAAQVAGDASAAESAYREFLKKYPARPEVLANLGALLARRENYTEAIGLYKRALRMDPSLHPLHLNLGLAYLKNTNYEAAVSEFDLFLKSVPDNRQARQLRAMALLELERYAEAEQAFQGLQPQNDLSVSLGLATALMRQGKSAEARALLEPVFARGDSAPVQLAMGQAMMDEGRIPEALEAFEKARALDPSLPLLRLNLGAVYWRQNKHSEAVSEWRAEYDAHPSSFEAVYTLGAALALNPETRDESARLLRRAVEIRPKNAHANYQLGKLIWQSSKSQEAASFLQRATESDRDFREAFFLYGTVLQAAGRKAEASRAFARAKEISARDLARQQDLFSESPSQSR